MLLDMYLLLLAVKYVFVFAAPPSVWHFSALVIISTSYSTSLIIVSKHCMCKIEYLYEH